MVKCNPMYLELPILAAARFAIGDGQNIVVKAGPYLAFGIAGKYKIAGVMKRMIFLVMMGEKI